ncbi:MAG: hypothetical protein ACMXYF_04725 [Candidatus Woesearchaeota archaeon]
MIKKEKQIPFLVALSFLISLIGIRLAVLLAGSAQSEFAQAAKAGTLPGTNFYIGSNIILFGYHIHHFYFGIIFISIAAWLAIVGSNTFSKKHVAILYGVGLGLFLDEIGLLLTWGDYYSNLTYIITLFVLALFMNSLFLQDYWQTFKEQMKTSKSPLQRLLRKEGQIFSSVDYIITSIFKKEQVSQLFSALIYITIAILIVILPQTLRYWIVGVFIIQGFHYIIRSSLLTVRNRNEANI